MQVIVKVRCGPQEYVDQQVHRRVRPPLLCPNCTKRNRLDVLGYYQRYSTDSEGKALAIQVRRFECAHCAITVSCLPDFAQPYRLVNHATTEAFFNGERHALDVQRNEDLLRRYWRRFLSWAPSLRKLLGSVFGRAPPGEDGKALWQRLQRTCKSFTDCTCRLVEEFRLTCYRSYRCHQPRLAR